MKKTLRILATTLALGSLTFAAACGSSSSSAPTKYLVALGDSYSVGYQPGIGTGPGYTDYAAKHLGLTLANFGCAGATTTSVLTQIGCPAAARAKAGVETYPNTTQVAAATAYIKAHKSQIALITVSISGNDVTACATQANPVTCVAAAAASIKTNVATLATQLRAAAGSSPKLIGTSYPDVLLGEYVYPSQPPSAAQLTLAQESVVAFKSLINPTLTTAYESAQGELVDVTAAMGAYGSLTEMTTLSPYGSIPVPVANICKLTWYCKEGNIHANTTGYDQIGQLVVASYKATSDNN